MTDLQASLPRTVIVPVDALLVLKGDIIRNFTYDIRSKGCMMRFSASVVFEEFQGTLVDRELLFPRTGPRDLPEELTFETCSDMFLQYHFKKICVPYSSQLALLYTRKKILNKSRIFRGGMTFLQGKDIQKLLKHDPISIVQQECMRQAILNIVLQIAGSSIAHFPVQSMYGLSFW